MVDHVIIITLKNITNYSQKHYKMEYYMNYMADAVVRVDGDNRYVKYDDEPAVEHLAKPDSKTAYGGVGFGVFYILKSITKEDYRNFGITWGFGEKADKMYPIT